MSELEKKRSKRESKQMSEPAGGLQHPMVAGHRYVMHKHAASHEHFDLRLERDGVLMSWALPKGPSLAPGEKRLAIRVEDHPLEYGSFEGVIPQEAYGGGTVMLWDRGEWKLAGKESHDRIDLVLVGEKLKGAWTLVRMKSSKQQGAKHWLLIKRSDDTKRMTEDLSAKDDRSVLSGRSMSQIAEQEGGSQK